jgi:hypothetical protein
VVLVAVELAAVGLVVELVALVGVELAELVAVGLVVLVVELVALVAVELAELAAVELVVLVVELVAVAVEMGESAVSHP